MAEGLAGTEEAFARLMNERARAIGLGDSHFVNATGWPAPGHVMSMRDLVRKLTVRLIEEFPEYYTDFALSEYEFDGRAPSNTRNRNPLLGLGIGADGLKTGHTREAGYGLVGSAKQGDRRIIFVVTGLESDRARAEESERIVSWAFRQFVQRTVATGGTRLAEVPVHMGASRTVGMVVPEDLNLLIPAIVQDTVEAEISYETPVRAPISGRPADRHAQDRTARHDRARIAPDRRDGRARGRFPAPHPHRDAGAAARSRRPRLAPLRAPMAQRGPAGFFISFEGIDGSGKSTQARMLAEALRARGEDPVLTREPGGSPGAEEIRKLLLTGDPARWSPQTEILLFTAARRDHLERTIAPALAAGRTVVTDRFADFHPRLSGRHAPGSGRRPARAGRQPARPDDRYGAEPDLRDRR